MTGSCDRWLELPRVGVWGPGWGAPPAAACSGGCPRQIAVSAHIGSCPPAPHPSRSVLAAPPSPPHPITRGAQALLGPSPSLPGSARFCRMKPCSCAPVCSGGGVSAPQFLPVMKRRRSDGGPGRVRDGVCPRGGPWGGASS